MIHHRAYPKRRLAEDTIKANRDRIAAFLVFLNKNLSNDSSDDPLLPRCLENRGAGESLCLQFCVRFLMEPMLPDSPVLIWLQFLLDRGVCFKTVQEVLNALISAATFITVQSDQTVLWTKQMVSMVPMIFWLRNFKVCFSLKWFLTVLRLKWTRVVAWSRQLTIWNNLVRGLIMMSSSGFTWPRFPPKISLQFAFVER